MSHHFNPSVGDFANSQVRSPPSSYLVARLLNTEEAHGNLAKSLSSAIQFSRELKMLHSEIRSSVDGSTNDVKANDMTSQKQNRAVPLPRKATSTARNGAASKSLPPHLRGGKSVTSITHETGKHGAESTVDLSSINSHEQKFPAPVLSPPESPRTMVETHLPKIVHLSLDTMSWRPHYVESLPTLPADSLSGVPIGEALVTFHPAFLHDTLKGDPWSPGLRFIKTPGPCMLPFRTYYELDPATDPFLPATPGAHGAKLTAFFNKSPEEDYGDLLPVDGNTYEDVPMFILSGGRYVYFGNYSQTRWSDKLDNDTMMTKVPQHVKDFWAHELTAHPRETWVTEALKKHFFPKPEYEGRIYAAPGDDTTVDTEDETQFNEKMSRDVTKYVQTLREWDREAKMKTSMMKKEFILDRFDAADVDDPPALRLYWEYLECVSWRQDFYDLLVTLQSRAPAKYLK
ncbi:hypothetical protein ACN47E_006853 [Coniothyrium glycines]